MSVVRTIILKIPVFTTNLRGFGRITLLENDMSPLIFNIHFALLWLFTMAFGAAAAVSYETGGYLLYPLMLGFWVVVEAILLLTLGRADTSGWSRA